MTVRSQGNEIKSFKNGLRDLGTSYVDIFYLHSPHITTPLEENVGAR